MRPINLIVVHCSATKEGVAINASAIDKMHKERKPPFKKIGYHYVILIDGKIEKGRDEQEIGAHVTGHNNRSIGICYVGGLDGDGKAKDTRTKEQKAALVTLLMELVGKYPDAEIVGHRDLSKDKNRDGKISRFEWIKECPCFDANEEYKHI
jgi:N-acetylmuramoyl-L-alanine amidase